MRLNRSVWRAFLAVILVVMPLTALVVVPAVGAADPVLYDQLTGGDGSWWVSNDFVEAHWNTFDEIIADDFVVTSGQTWSITQVSTVGRPHHPAETDPTTFNVFIFANAVNKPGSVLWSGTNLAYTKIGSQYDIPVAGVPDLTAGTYWLGVQGNSAWDSGFQRWAWDTRAPQVGQPAQYQNPGGSRGTGCPTWAQRSTCQAASTSYNYSGVPGGPDQRFALYGLDQPNNPPVNTVPGATQTIRDDQTITFSVGNSNAISVADPDAGTANLQVSLSVLHGTLTVAPGSGVNFGCAPCGGNGTGTVVFRGNLTEINNALNGLIYEPNHGYGGPDTLTILTNDRGNTGTGGAKTDSDTVAIVVQARTIVDTVSGTVEYGGANANLTARLRTVDGDIPVPGQELIFKINGAAVCGGTGQPVCPTTNASGIATLTGTIDNPGLNVGNHAGVLTVEFEGSQYFLSSEGTGNLRVTRKILWVKPVDRTVGLKQPNPPTNPRLDPACSAPNWCLELTNGSTFVPGDDFSDLNTTNLRFQYGRNYPQTNATEFVGKTYRITASGIPDGNYDIRYAPGTLTVVPVAP